MTEAEWMACTDPASMIDYLQPNRLLSDRKMRLFLVARCRLTSDLLSDERSRKAVEAAERYADRGATGDELNQVFGPAWVAARDLDTAAAWWASYAVSFVAWDGWAMGKSRRATDTAQFKARQADLLHDIFGNPFRPMPPLAPSLLTWQDGLVRRLAEQAYDQRQLPSGQLDNACLAVLADALLEAGCDDADIIGHLRQQGVHVRGCFLLDLLLGKE